MTHVNSGATADWLNARVKATPSKIFLHIGEDKYSFAAVDRLVGATAALIYHHARITKGDHVALLMPNGLPCVLSLLALMRLGAVIVPLNTRLIAEELRWQIGNTDCSLLLCERETKALARSVADNALVIPETSCLKASAHIDQPVINDLDADFAIIHTSGTSGRPKAAVLTRNNILQSALASAFRLGLQPDDRWLCILPLYHVGGLSIVLRSLIYGTAVELMSARGFDVDAVNRLLAERPITLVSLAPTMLTRLLDAKASAWNAQLRLILLGGEATPLALVSRCLERKIPIAPSYGLSEAASQVATATPDQVSDKPGSVGKPLLFTELRVVDESGNDLPPGRAGEILVRGPGVMRAYYKDSAATANALRDGWLHTGDIGYLDEYGDLYTLQRREDLIVSGGENIYPVEVENALRAHPAINEVVALGLPDDAWGQKVIAAVQLKTGMDAASDEIIACARENLASYKVPREIRFVSDFPRTASGKIQRRLLRNTIDE